MLILEAEIYFYKSSECKEALQHDLNTENVIRPSINFGNNLLFSGTLKVSDNIKKLVRGEHYIVTIEMPTVEKEVFHEIEELVFIGSNFTIQNASRVIGSGKVVDYIYES